MYIQINTHTSSCSLCPARDGLGDGVRSCLRRRQELNHDNSNSNNNNNNNNNNENNNNNNTNNDNNNNDHNNSNKLVIICLYIYIYNYIYIYIYIHLRRGRVAGPSQVISVTPVLGAYICTRPMMVPSAVVATPFANGRVMTLLGSNVINYKVTML